MRNLYITTILVLSISCKNSISQKVQRVSVGFYNVENLFDYHDDPTIYDEEYLPNGKRKWTKERYNEKLVNLAEVISEMSNGQAPTYLGMCEVENRNVVQDLISTEGLKSLNYGIAHEESPDERGIDVAFIYQKDAFKVDHIETVQPDLSSYDDKTRDILYVSGKTNDGETLHFLINHWPSRGEGSKESEPKRVIAANTLKAMVVDIQNSYENAKIIVMGDFNDEPSNKSISETLGVSCTNSTVNSAPLFNPFCALEDANMGSYRYRKHWDMLDQIMVSKPLVEANQGLTYQKKSASIKAEHWMIQTGKYEGFPLRSFGGLKYLGGYSDHFPVFINLK